MTRFRHSDDFGPTLEAVAERLDISATAVEKDYWVSEVLRVLVANFPGDFIFKGGTSLSKGYGIVERFSEDIDVLVLPGNRGRGASDKLMKAMGEAAATGIGGEASGAGAETGRHRAYTVSYPATREPTALITTTVLLEMASAVVRNRTSLLRSGRCSAMRSVTREPISTTTRTSHRSRCKCSTQRGRCSRSSSTSMNWRLSSPTTKTASLSCRRGDLNSD